MRDQSSLIPVPDHQEVFLDHGTGECLIVEIVEHNPGSPQDVCRIYIDDLGQLNEATSVRDVSCETSDGLEALPAMRELASHPGLAGCRALTCSCTMDLPKDGNGISFQILILQLPEHSADLVVSVRQALHLSSGDQSDRTRESRTFSKIRDSFVLGDDFGGLFQA